MALFWIIHSKVDESTVRALESAHNMDLAIDEPHGARCLRYWFNRTTRDVYCLVEGPDERTAATAHRSGSGLVPDVIIEVEAGPIAAD